MRSNRAGCWALIASIRRAIRAAMRVFQNSFSVTVNPGMVILLEVDGLGWESTPVTTRPAGSDVGGRLEPVDKPPGLGQRQVLGPRHAVLVPQQALHVRVLGLGHRVDRLG